MMKRASASARRLSMRSTQSAQSPPQSGLSTGSPRHGPGLVVELVLEVSLVSVPVIVVGNLASYLLMLALT